MEGPRDTDCWIWTGALGDDGYGRFWVGRAGNQRTLRPSRIAYALAEGTSVDHHPVVEHLVCDNPICVRADGTRFDHLLGSTQAANLSRIKMNGRSSRRVYRRRIGSRQETYRRSKAIRDAVKDGWDSEKIARALALVDDAQLSLF